MTDTQDFWFPEVIGQEEGPGFLIKIPKACTKCNSTLVVKAGTPPEMSWLDKPCEHVWDWHDLLKMRVDVPQEKKEEPSKGGHCTGCNLYNEYLNGPYKCFTCKQPH